MILESHISLSRGGRLAGLQIAHPITCRRRTWLVQPALDSEIIEQPISYWPRGRRKAVAEAEAAEVKHTVVKAETADAQRLKPPREAAGVLVRMVQRERQVAQLF